MPKDADPYRGELFLELPVGTVVQFRVVESWRIPDDPSEETALIVTKPSEASNHDLVLLTNGALAEWYYADVKFIEILDFITPDGTTADEYVDIGRPLIKEYSADIGHISLESAVLHPLPWD